MSGCTTSCDTSTGIPPVIDARRVWSSPLLQSSCPPAWEHISSNASYHWYSTSVKGSLRLTAACTALHYTSGL